MTSKTNVPTISLDDAVARVTRFRDQLITQVPEANIPRAVFIPIGDLLSIIKNYDLTDANGIVVNQLQGVRAYFAIKESDMDLPDMVTAIVVPVDKKGNDIIYADGAPTGTGEGDETAIYDFTKPCPAECDPESPLFID